MARNNDSARNDLVEFLMHGYRLGHESFATGVLARFARKRNGIASSVAIALFLAFTPIAFAQLQLIPSGGAAGNNPATNPAQAPQNRNGTTNAAGSSTQPPAPIISGSGQAATSGPQQTNTPAVTSPAPVAPVGDIASISIESVTAYLQQLQSATDLDANLKQSLVTAYEALLAELKSRSENEKYFKELLAAYEAAPTATAEAKKRKESFSPRFIYLESSLDSAPIERLQSYQLELQSLLQTAVDGRAKVDATIVSREAQKKELPRLLSEAKAAITKLNDELNAPPVEGTDPRLREANLLLLRARLMSLNERSRRIEQEQRTYDAETELLSLQKANFSTEEKYYQAKIKEVTEELNKRRESLIAKQKKLAESMVSQSPGDLRGRAEQIVIRTDAWLGLAKQNALMRLESDAARAELKLWTERYRIMTERMSHESTKNVTNFNSMVGLMLRKQRSELPDINELTDKLHDFQEKLVATQTLILELDDWKAASAAVIEPESFTDESAQFFSTADLREKARLLHNFEHRVVDEFRIDANSYFESLFNLGVNTQQTIEQVKKYRSFIDEHVLWIRSSEAFQLSDAREVWPSLQWLFQFGNWREIPALMLNDLQYHLWGYLLGAGVLMALAFNIKRLKAETIKQGELASRPNCTSLIPTWKTMLACFLLACPLAIIHLVIGWRLNHSENRAFAEAIGMGLMVGARYFFPLELLRQVCRSGGLAENHFQWSTSSTSILRKNLRWFIDLAVPCVCVVAVLAQFGESKYENSLGRIIYAALMLLCFLFLIRCLHPTQGVFSNFLKNHPGGWIDRLKYLWYPIFACGPLALMLMSLMGYHYTSVRLAMHLHTTFITLVGILLLSSFIYRWLLLRRRVLLVAQAKQRLEEARRRDPNAPTLPNPLLDSHADLASINKQTIRLVTSTLIFASIAAVAVIWSTVLPAVGVLDAVQLWTVDGMTPGERIPITLTNLLIAIPTGIMTVVAARNLPGLLEIALLQHLPLENAVRYAISSISRYTILFLGILMTFNSMGIRWASIQWLVAALGVGLGFGLQEIFANFVSGLILLFEQPVRVGDVITLGDTTGTVSRIRMRATTVTNFDQQELIIPNKDLVTGRLLNWTLTDSTNRMMMLISISNDSDPEVACALIREVCLEHPNILKEPAPTAFLEEFGENKQLIRVRCFLASLDLRLPTRHEVHLLIRKRFAELGIQISIPQQEVHLRNFPSDWKKPDNPTLEETGLARQPVDQPTSPA